MIIRKRRLRNSLGQLLSAFPISSECSPIVHPNIVLTTCKRNPINKKEKKDDHQTKISGSESLDITSTRISSIPLSIIVCSIASFLLRTTSIT